MDRFQIIKEEYQVTPGQTLQIEAPDFPPIVEESDKWRIHTKHIDPHIEIDGAVVRVTWVRHCELSRRTDWDE